MAEKKVQQSKIDAVKELKETFKGSSDFFFSNYRGLTVGQISELRGKLREQSAEYKVVKNNYAKIALKNMGVEGVDDLLKGPTAVTIMRDEAGPAAKALLAFEKDSPLEVKGGYVNGDVYAYDQVVAFSKLPTRGELIAQLMSTMNAPVQNVARCIHAVPEKLVRTLQAVADKKAEEG